MKGGKTSITIAKIRNDIITKTASNERNLGSLKVICIWLHKLQMIFDITKEQIRKIAEDKMVDLNAFTIESAMKMVAGTARSMGLNVKGPSPF